MVTYGTLMYPLPGLIIVADVTTPLTTVAVAVACIPLITSGAEIAIPTLPAVYPAPPL